MNENEEKDLYTEGVKDFEIWMESMFKKLKNKENERSN